MCESRPSHRGSTILGHQHPDRNNRSSRLVRAWCPQPPNLSLIWRLHQLANPVKLPRQRTVLHLTLTGPGAAQGWLDIQHGAVTVCRDDPGYDIDLAITADTGQMQRWLVGLVPFRDLIANGHARMLGPSRLARAFPTWFDTTRYAEALRRAEQRHRVQAMPA